MKLKLFTLIFILFFIISCAHSSMDVRDKELFSYASELTSRGMYEDALDYYMNILQKDINKDFKAKVYNNMAVIYEIQGDNIKARKYYREAIELTNNENIYQNYKLFLDTL